MFGTNILRKYEDTDGRELQVHSIFPTIQGEGPFAGQPAIFIRLTGCNLKCYFCDTAWNDFDDPHLSIPEILDRVHTLSRDNVKTTLVVITGGEPMRQNIVPLVNSLNGDGYHVQLETAGSLWVDGLERSKELLSVVVSPKTGKVHPKINIFASAWKYVVQADGTDPKDGLPVASTQTKGRTVKIARPGNSAPIYIQPIDAYDDDQNQKNMAEAVDICMKHGYKLCIQTHKVAGLE